MLLRIDQDRKNTPVTMQSLQGISSVVSGRRLNRVVVTNITGMKPDCYAFVALAFANKNI
jgi:hypothetical protein